MMYRQQMEKEGYKYAGHGLFYSKPEELQDQSFISSDEEESTEEEAKCWCGCGETVEQL